ncbi:MULTISPECIES: type II secretion system protein N [unclassified Variovorax]|uniref:type II secretion system protein N n=1 Tax=unclassified Variovorax TaxID=663243 RepID=UPI0008CB8A95|nr:MULTISPECIES: type II secretion system protein N [unclassified Variovorax]SEJ03969.1 general secretion pathway protein C [Variovorax sp. OK202]SFB93057.1 general secretion pathway protein C [Variovorax sp. OK212]
MTSPYSAARWHAPLATTGLWALAAGAAVFWALRLASPADAVAAAATMPRPSLSADTDAVARLLGVLPTSSTAPVAPEAASRFALSGVVADPSKQGAALISIDGKAPRPFRVGSKVGDNYVLQSVGLRSATLGAQADGPAAFTLQLPVRAPISVSSVSGVAPGLPTVASPPSVPMGMAMTAPPPATMPGVMAPPPMQQQPAAMSAPPQAPAQ